MKAFLDTSVLVAAFYADHAHHAPSLDAFVRYPRKDSSCAAHTLAEVYSTLTRMPGKYRVSGEQAMLFIADVEERLTLIGLTAAEYVRALESCAKLGVAGGATYDALLAACALKAQAETLYSWNLRHYAQLGADVTERLRTP